MWKKVVVENASRKPNLNIFRQDKIHCQNGKELVVLRRHLLINKKTIWKLFILKSSFAINKKKKDCRRSFCLLILTKFFTQQKVFSFGFWLFWIQSHLHSDGFRSNFCFSGQVGLASLVWVWIWKISPKNHKFFNFFPFESKKYLRVSSKSTRVKRKLAYSYLLRVKVCSGWVRAYLYSSINFTSRLGWQLNLSFHGDGSRSIFCGSGRISHLWFAFGFRKFALKMANF